VVDPYSQVAEAGEFVYIPVSGLDKMVKVNVYLCEMADFAAMNDVYATYFPEESSARTCIASRQVPFDIPVEIEALLKYDEDRDGLIAVSWIYSWGHRILPAWH